MSILIKGMKIPKSCEECYFMVCGYPDWCHFTTHDIPNEKEKPDFCPLEEAKERPKGKWEEAKKRGCVVYAEPYAECSLCHEVSWFGRRMRFCPNCGAKMEEIK